jgi:uncharacterized membrane protein YbhN (UPF0104 family)
LRGYCSGIDPFVFILRRVTSSTAFKSVLAIALLGYLVYLVDFREIVETARSANLLLISAAMFLLPLNVYIEGTLWHRITGLVVSEPRRLSSFGSLMSGYALGLLTPARIGELAGRSFYLDHQDKWSLGALVMFQRLIDMVVGVAVGLVALVAFMVLVQPQATTFWMLVIAAGVVALPALGFVLIQPAPAFRVISRFVRKQRILEPLAFLQRIRPRHISPFLALAVLRYLTFVGQFVILLYAFGADGAVVAAWLGAAMTFYGKYMIPSVTIMDIGVREGSAVFFMGVVGFMQASAFNASLFLFVINLVIPAALGIPFVMRLRMARRSEEASTQPSRRVEETAGVS